jgi:hypothetical protein
MPGHSYSLFREYAAFASMYCSVTDPGCLSRMLIFTHLGSRISDPGSKNSNKREGRKKISCHPFFCSPKFNKIEYYFVSEMMKKKIWAKFQRIFEVFTQKNCHQALKNMGLGSGIRKKTYSGSRIQGSKRHRIPDPQH